MCGLRCGPSNGFVPLALRLRRVAFAVAIRTQLKMTTPSGRPPCRQEPSRKPLLCSPGSTGRPPTGRVDARRLLARRPGYCSPPACCRGVRRCRRPRRPILNNRLSQSSGMRMRCIARRYWHTSRCSKILAAMVERRYWMRTRQSSSSTPPLRSCMPASSIPTLDRRFHRRCSHCRPRRAGHAGRQSRLRTCTRHERCVVGNGYGGELWPAVEIADTEIQRPGADHAAFAAVSAAAGCSRSEVRAARDDDESGRCAEGGSGTSTPRSSNSMRSRLRGGSTPHGAV